VIRANGDILVITHEKEFVVKPGDPGYQYWHEIGSARGPERQSGGWGTLLGGLLVVRIVVALAVIAVLAFWVNNLESRLSDVSHAQQAFDKVNQMANCLLGTQTGPNCGQLPSGYAPLTQLTTDTTPLTP
jgi:hypothetical protein